MKRLRDLKIFKRFSFLNFKLHRTADILCQNHHLWVYQPASNARMFSFRGCASVRERGAAAAFANTRAPARKNTKFHSVVVGIGMTRALCCTTTAPTVGTSRAVSVWCEGVEGIRY